MLFLFKEILKIVFIRFRHISSTLDYNMKQNFNFGAACVIMCYL